MTETLPPEILIIGCIENLDRLFSALDILFVCRRVRIYENPGELLKQLRPIPSVDTKATANNNKASDLSWKTSNQNRMKFQRKYAVVDAGVFQTDELMLRQLRLNGIKPIHSSLILSSAYCKISLPYFTSPRPLFNNLLYDANVYLLHFTTNERHELAQLVHHVGGRIAPRFDLELINIIITMDLTGSKIFHIKNIRSSPNVPCVVTRSWIDQVWKHRYDVEQNFKPFSSMNLNQHEAKTFSGCVFYFYELTEKEKETVSCTIAEGAKVTNNPEDASITHVIVSYDNVRTAGFTHSEIGVTNGEAPIIYFTWVYASLAATMQKECALYNASTNMNVFSISSPITSPIREQSSLSVFSGDQTSWFRSIDTLTLSEDEVNTSGVADTVDGGVGGGHNNSPDLHNLRTKPMYRKPMSPNPSVIQGGTEHQKSIEKRSRASLNKSKRSVRYLTACEYLQTEENYVDALKFIQIVQESVCDENQPGGSFARLLPPNVLFTPFFPIRTLHENILTKLKSIVDNWNEATSCIGSVLEELRCDAFIKAYRSYYESQEEAQRIFNEVDKDPRAHGFLRMLESRPEAKRQSIKSFFIRPTQRLCSVTLLLERLLSHTQTLHPDYALLESGLEGLKSQLLEANNHMKAMAKLKDTLKLPLLIENLPANIVSSRRCLLFYADAVILGRENPLEGTIVRLHIFRDLIVITKFKGDLDPHCVTNLNLLPLVEIAKSKLPPLPPPPPASSSISSSLQLSSILTSSKEVNNCYQTPPAAHHHHNSPPSSSIKASSVTRLKAMLQDSTNHSGNANKRATISSSTAVNLSNTTANNSGMLGTAGGGGANGDNRQSLNLNNKLTTATQSQFKYLTFIEFKSIQKFVDLHVNKQSCNEDYLAFGIQFENVGNKPMQLDSLVDTNNSIMPTSSKIGLSNFYVCPTATTMSYNTIVAGGADDEDNNNHPWLYFGLIFPHKQFRAVQGDYGIAAQENRHVKMTRLKKFSRENNMLAKLYKDLLLRLMTNAVVLTKLNNENDEIPAELSEHLCQQRSSGILTTDDQEQILSRIDLNTPALQLTPGDDSMIIQAHADNHDVNVSITHQAIGSFAKRMRMKVGKSLASTRTPRKTNRVSSMRGHRTHGGGNNKTLRASGLTYERSFSPPRSTISYDSHVECSEFSMSASGSTTTLSSVASNTTNNTNNNNCKPAALTLLWPCNNNSSTPLDSPSHFKRGYDTRIASVSELHLTLALSRKDANGSNHHDLMMSETLTNNSRGKCRDSLDNSELFSQRQLSTTTTTTTTTAASSSHLSIGNFDDRSSIGSFTRSIKNTNFISRAKGQLRKLRHSLLGQADDHDQISSKYDNANPILTCSTNSLSSIKSNNQNKNEFQAPSGLPPRSKIAQQALRFFKGNKNSSSSAVAAAASSSSASVNENHDLHFISGPSSMGHKIVSASSSASLAIHCQSTAAASLGGDGGGVDCGQNMLRSQVPSASQSVVSLPGWSSSNEEARRSMGFVSIHRLTHLKDSFRPSKANKSRRYVSKSIDI